jgi:iron-sulfur cluster repair protein YtfE (RIC family)
MKPTEMLKEDHRRVDRLFQKVKNTPKGEHLALFEQIKAELDVHAHIEETAFYPVLLKKGKKDLQDITREGIEEHAQAKMFLAEIDGTTLRNKQYEAKLKVLMEDIEHHVTEEEDTMFPMVEDQFTTAAQEKMTAAMETAKAKFIKTMTPDEQKALERSLAGANEKGPVGKAIAAAKEVVTNILAGNGISIEPVDESAKANGKAKTVSAKSTGSAKATESKSAKVDKTVTKVQTARAQK